MANVRKLNDDEMKKWSQAIHKACQGSDGGRQMMWLPALRAAYSHLMPFIDYGCATAETDCYYRIGLSPRMFTDEVSVEQLAMVMIHEALHNTQHHRQRFYEDKGVNGKLVNYATDLEINSIIAEGIMGIKLERKPSPSNGHWENLFGRFWKLDDNEVEKLNAAGRNVSKGDWEYEGGLFPKVHPFEDFPVNLTAEQYMSMLEADTEEISLQEFLDQVKKDRASNGPDAGNGKGNASNGNESNSGNGGGNVGSSSEESNDNDASNDTGDGSEASASDNGDGKNHNGEGYKPGDIVDDGHGGGAIINDDASVTVTRIYKRNKDGSRTEIGRDAAINVDRIDIDLNDDVWNEASRIGINPISRGEEQNVKDQIAHDISTMKQSTWYGSAAGSRLLKYIDNGLRPPLVNWRKALSHTVGKSCQEQTKGHDDYTYRRLSRRYSQGRFKSPGMTSYVPSILFALDTSGSMSANEYKNALSEAEGIIRRIHANISMVCVDTQTYGVKKIRSVKDMTSTLTGGGGTDMSPVLDMIVDEKPKDRPDVIIIGTDGIWDWDEFMQACENPVLRKTEIIVLIVDDPKYVDQYTRTNDIRDLQNKLRKHHKKSKVLLAWTTK